MVEAEHLLSVQCVLGEGPLWDYRSGVLWWVDINGRRLYQYDPIGKAHQSWATAVQVTALGLRDAGGFIAATSQGLAFWRDAESEMSWIADPEQGKPGARFNDAKVDPQGRFWAGTMTFEEGASSALYRLDPDLRLQVMVTGLTISNGLGWSPDGHTLYHADTRRGIILAYDFDKDSGEIHHRRIFHQFSSGEGSPDGLTVDSEGGIWCALWGGGRVVHISPAGNMVNAVQLPVTQPSCCAFGGAGLEELYITTAYEGLSVKERSLQPLAGDVFVARPGVSGRREPRFTG